MKHIRYTIVWHLLMILAILLCIPSSASSRQDSFTNSLGMEFKRIPAGTFIMGSASDEPWRDEGETLRRITISKPFYLQTTEVTLGQWRKLMVRGLLGFLNRRKGPDALPVSRTCYHDAQAFLSKLNALGEGQYRLPTEAQWEYAARAGTRTVYSWGDTIDCSKAVYANKSGRFDSCTAYLKNHGLPPNGPSPVKSFAPNPWGLFDMHGNVWEWCQDWFEPYPMGDQTDPLGPAKAIHRVRRGGSWFGEGYKCRSANRAFGHPDSRLRNTGFRVVMIVPPKPKETR